MSRLKVEASIKPGVYKVTLRGHSAMTEIKIVNGRAVYGFAEPAPDPDVEGALARFNSKKLAELVRAAVLS